MPSGMASLTTMSTAGLAPPPPYDRSGRQALLDTLTMALNWCPTKSGDGSGGSRRPATVRRDGRGVRNGLAAPAVTWPGATVWVDQFRGDRAQDRPLGLPARRAGRHPDLGLISTLAERRPVESASRAPVGPRGSARSRGSTRRDHQCQSEQPCQHHGEPGRSGTRRRGPPVPGAGRR